MGFFDDRDRLPVGPSWSQQIGNASNRICHGSDYRVGESSQEWSSEIGFLASS